MSISLGANGGSYSYPQENDPAGWGDDATNWASAVSAALGNIGLGGTVSATSLIDMSGTTTKGFLPPKLTTVQRNAIATPPAGLVIYNTTTSQLEVYTGSSWFSVASNINGNLTVNGNSTLNGTLTVTGTTSLASVTGTGLTVNGSTTLNGDLTVTGATSLQSLSSLNVTGNTTLVNVTGANITSTGTILAASGTSGSPGISFSGDSNSGFYSISDNVIGVATNGTRVGQIGIGYGGFTGNIIQVVNGSTTTQVAESSNTFTDTGLSATITPKYSNSKILIISSVQYFNSASTTYGQQQRLLRGSTTLLQYDGLIGYAQVGSGMETYNYIDSPATTSSTTYKIQFRTRSAGNAAHVQYNEGTGAPTSYMTLMEIQV